MTIKYYILIFALLLSSCAVLKTPNFETGGDCWRYGVEEEENTGPLSPTPLQKIPVVKLWYGDLAQACGVQIPELSFKTKQYMVVRACYVPQQIPRKTGDDTFYLYKLAGAMELRHEQCHLVLGRLHGNCYGTGYGNSGTAEHPCEW